MVVLRHYAPRAEGLVYLPKAVLSTLAVLDKHNEADSVNPQRNTTRNSVVGQTFLEITAFVLLIRFNFRARHQIFLIHEMNTV